MSDAAPPLRFAGPSEELRTGPLSPECIERVLADFRDWLSDASAFDGAMADESESIDLHTLVAQFTALRHEVNLQTKATRAAVEQNAAALTHLEKSLGTLADTRRPENDGHERLRPLIKSIVDVYDALALANRHVEKQKPAIKAGLADLVQIAAIERPPVVAEGEDRTTFWSRFFGNNSSAPAAAAQLAQWHQTATRTIKDREQRILDASNYLNDALDGLLAGYAMSMNRIDRVLNSFQLEPIRCVGCRFDPESMEVVEAVPNSGRPLGEVIEEVRRGYRWNGDMFRYAQVRVAR